MGILAKVEKRASIENPSTSLSNPAAWLVDALGGGETASGVPVNQATALQQSAVWACVNVLSQDVAKLPLLTFRRLERGKERATEDPRFRILRLQANPQMSSYNFRRTLQAHVTTWGNAYAEIELNNAGDLMALWPLLPDRTEAVRKDGEKFFVTRVGAKDISLAADKVLHIPGLGFDGLRGYSVIAQAREAIGLGKATETYGSGFFGGGARPGGVIMRDTSLTEEAQDRLRRSWDASHQGLSNAQRVAILDEGMKYEQIGVPPEDAQFLATQQFSVEQIARFFRMPPHKIQHLLHAGVRANVEAENISFVQDTLLAWLVNWEQEINISLFTEEEQKTLFAEHELKGMLRGDAEARSKFYQSGITNGWLSPNQAAEAENLNPVEGGDQHFIPLNLIPLDQAGSMSLNSSDGDDIDQNSLRTKLIERRQANSAIERHRLQQAHLRGFRSAAERIVEQENKGLGKIITRAYAGEGGPVELQSEMRNFYESFGRTIFRGYQPVVQTFADEIARVIANELGKSEEPDPNYESFVNDFIAGMASRHAGKSQDQLMAVTRENGIEEQEAALNQRLEEWEERRAGKIADVESVRANGAFSKMGYVLAGIFVLSWRTIGKNCPFCNKLNGKTVSIQSNFMNTGEILDPGIDGVKPMTVKKSFGHPPAHNGCDCVVTPGF